jgi:hypothetical protein
MSATRSRPTLLSTLTTRPVLPGWMRKRRRKTGQGPSPSVSVREVSLIGLVREMPVPECRAGHQLVRSGRSYRVESIQRPARTDAPVYVYLAAPAERLAQK